MGPRKGFTLVEIAIVLVVIGLLIGGILAARSMIETATTNKMVSQFSAYETAIRNFKQRFNGLPGDIQNSQFNIAAGVGGDGDGKVTSTNSGGNTFEQTLAWAHLQAAGLKFPDNNILTGILYARGDGVQYPVGITNPKTPYGQNIGILIGYNTSVSGYNGYGYYGSEVYWYKHYFQIYKESTNWAEQGLYAKQAGSLDAKIDDGYIDTGKVVKGAHNGCNASDNHRYDYDGTWNPNPCLLSYFPDDTFE